MSEQNLLNRLNDALLTEAAEEVASLRVAINRVIAAIEVEGVNPTYHRRVMKEHRRQWPRLWEALDLLQDEVRRG